VRTSSRARGPPAPARPSGGVERHREAGVPRRGRTPSWARARSDVVGAQLDPLAVDVGTRRPSSLRARRSAAAVGVAERAFSFGMSGPTRGPSAESRGSPRRSRSPSRSSTGSSTFTFRSSRPARRAPGQPDRAGQDHQGASQRLADLHGRRRCGPRGPTSPADGATNISASKPGSSAGSARASRQVHRARRGRPRTVQLIGVDGQNGASSRLSATRHSCRSPARPGRPTSRTGTRPAHVPVRHVVHGARAPGWRASASSSPAHG